jgi:hypothetical protein
MGSRGDHFRFGSVFIKKSNQTEIFKKNKTETRSNGPVSIWFFREKNQFKPVWLGFSGFGLVFSVFGSVFFGFGSVFFSFFCFGSVRFF